MKIKIISTSTLIVIVLCIICFYKFNASGINVTIRNNTNQEIKNLKLVCSSNIPDTIDIEKISSDDKISISLKLYENFSEGNLKLHYLDKNNVIQEIILIDYFERGYNSNIKVNINGVSSEGIIELEYK